MEAATYSSSYIYASPADEEAVMARAPAAEAPMQVDMAECSDSTAMNSVPTSPSATYCEKCSGISVEGVMGKAPTTSGLICFMARATAALPDKRSLIILLPPLPS